MWKENIWCIFSVKSPFPNSSGVPVSVRELITLSCVRMSLNKMYSTGWVKSDYNVGHWVKMTAHALLISQGQGSDEIHVGKIFIWNTVSIEVVLVHIFRPVWPDVNIKTSFPSFPEYARWSSHCFPQHRRRRSCATSQMNVWVWDYGKQKNV